MYKITIFAILATAVFCLAAAAPQIPGLPQRVCKAEDHEVSLQCASQCEEKCGRERPGFCNGGIQCLGFGCGCAKGYKRYEPTGKCILASECP